MFTLFMAAVSLFSVGSLLEKENKHDNFVSKETTKEDFFKEMGWE